MNPSPPDETDLVAAALALPDEAGREAFLEAACGGDSLLRERVGARLVAALVTRETNAQVRSEAATIQLLRDDQAPMTEQPGSRIGRYKLLQKIGEGGCGTVFMAEQQEPVRRRVALKIIKLGMDTRSVIARFEAERQALAMMDHPNIARVLDAGATETGRPFFVMELVRGVPITKYCDESQLDNRARLELFIKVCHAIQHAHQKGVIHRDIKPSNILVTLHDGAPVPKVIDFGIAKATTGERLTSLTLFTAYEQFIGTPAYMSPEQAEMSGLDIDTRSDIYSLGVLLYEMLTGATPFNARELAAAGLDEIRRRIREEEPIPPSTRISTLVGDDLTAVARSHSTEAVRMASLLRGDLDWVVMKCLEKERSRRYDTATALAGDIQRHLQDEPVTARPPGAAYRLQKFYRRHRTGFISGTAAVLMLLAGLATAAWQAVRAGRAEIAERAQSQLARVERDRAVSAEKSAKTQAEAANEAMRRATKSERESKENLYAADIRVAFEHVRMDNLKAARQLMQQHVPAQGEAEFRGFEWRYLWAQTQGDPHTILTNSGFGGSSWISLSPDGKFTVLTIMGGVTVLENAGGREVFSSRQERQPRPVEDSPPPGSSTLSAHGGPLPRRGGRPSPGNSVFTPDGRTLITANESGVQFIDTTTWQKRPTALEGATGQVSLSADGTVMATESTEGVRLWHLKGDAWSPEHLLPQSTRPFTLSPDGQRLLAGIKGDGTLPFAGLELWKLESQPTAVLLAGSENLLSHPSQLLLSTRSIAFSPDGKLIATASWTGDLPVTLWDGNNGSRLFVLTGHSGSITTVDFSLDSKTLATASLDSTIRVWDLNTRRLIRKQLGHLEQVNALRYSADGSFILSSSADGEVFRWPIVPAPIPVSRDAEENLCWLSPDGAEIATFSPTAGLHFWNTDSGQTIRRWPVTASNRSRSVKVSPDGRLAALGQADGSIAILSCATGTSVSLKGHPGGVEAFEFSPDGRLLVSTGRDRRLRWWDLVAREQVAETEMEGRDRRGPGSMVSDFAFSPDGLTLAGAGLRGLQKWSTTTHEALPCDIPAWMRVNYSPDGRWLVVGAFGEEVRLFEAGATTGEPRAAFAGHSEGVLGCAIAPDGLSLVSTSSDGTLRIWSMATSRELALFWQKGRGFDRPMFSRDGRVLAVGSSQGTGGQVILWRAPSWEEIAAMEKPRPTPLRRDDQPTPPPPVGLLPK